MHDALLKSLLLIGALSANCVQAEENGFTYSGSGFLTISVGKMLGGTRGNVGDYECPCFVADYAQAAIFDGRSDLQWGPDSKLGLQGSIDSAQKQFSLTGQVVARGASRGGADIEWLYATYRPSDNLSVQAGRKRLPMFYYSDAQDIGFALPWTHLPTWLYGWQAVNYNGVSLTYRNSLGEWAATANLLAGNEHRKDSGYWKVYGNGRQSVTDVHWTNIVGGDLNLSREWFEGRLVYLQSDTQDVNVNGAWNYTTRSYDPPAANAPVARQKIYGLALKADYENWLLFGELIRIDHPGLTYRDDAQIVSLGYRFGKWIPMLTWNHFKGTVVTTGVLPGAPASTANAQQTTTLSLRYDLTTSSDLKIQYDDTRDNSPPDFNPRYGDSRLLTLAYDLTF